MTSPMRAAPRARIVTAGLVMVSLILAGALLHAHSGGGAGRGGGPGETFRHAGTRDPFVQPFASTAIWNHPIGDASRYVPANLTPPSVRALTADETVVLMDPAAPSTDIQRNGGQHSDRCVGRGAPLATALIPVSAVAQR